MTISDSRLQPSLQGQVAGDERQPNPELLVSAGRAGNLPTPPLARRMSAQNLKWVSFTGPVRIASRHFSPIPDLV